MSDETLIPRFARGARPSPRHKLLAATPHRVAKAPPAQFAVVPKQLSYWDNNQAGDCVTAEEAYAKAVWSIMCGLDELFIPDQEVIRWATKYGYMNGADLSEVMDRMAEDGFTVNGVNYKDGPKLGVDYSNETVLQSAISTGPVKIAIDANALPGGAGNGNGWWTISTGNYGNTDHCVGLSGYGPAAWLFQQLGVPLPSGLSATQAGYLLFTWSSIGFVTHGWLMGTCTEAWVRTPTTPGQQPAPTPTPTPTPPVPPTPTPTPTPGAAVTITLTGDQVASVISQSGQVTISGNMSLSDAVAAIQKAAATRSLFLPNVPSVPAKQGGGIMRSIFFAVAVGVIGSAVLGAGLIHGGSVAASVKKAVKTALAPVPPEVPPAPAPVPPAKEKPVTCCCVTTGEGCGCAEGTLCPCEECLCAVCPGAAVDQFGTRYERVKGAFECVNGWNKQRYRWNGVTWLPVKPGVGVAAGSAAGACSGGR